MRLIALILFAFTFGCDHKICTTPPPPTPIRFINSAGQDLLNPQNPNSYSISDIRIYYLENGNTRYETVGLDSIPGTSTFFLANNLPWHSQNGRSYFIQLAYNDIDTIYMRCDQVSKHGCTSFELKEFKYNNVIIPVKCFTGIQYSLCVNEVTK